MANKKIYKVMLWTGAILDYTEEDKISITRTFKVPGDARTHRQTRRYPYNEKRMNTLISVLGKSKSFEMIWTK